MSNALMEGQTLESLHEEPNWEDIKSMYENDDELSELMNKARIDHETKTVEFDVDEAVALDDPDHSSTEKGSEDDDEDDDDETINFDSSA